MKKIIAVLILIFIIVISFCACKKNYDLNTLFKEAANNRGTCHIVSQTVDKDNEDNINISMSKDGYYMIEITQNKKCTWYAFMDKKSFEKAIYAAFDVHNKTKVEIQGTVCYNFYTYTWIRMSDKSSSKTSEFADYKWTYEYVVEDNLMSTCLLYLKSM